MYDSARSLYLGDFLVSGLVYFYVHYALVFLEKEWKVEAPLVHHAFVFSAGDVGRR